MKRRISVQTLILAGSLLLQLSTLCFHARGAAGDVDLSFDPGSGVNGTVNAIAVQPDGKVLIGGAFTTVKGLARANLARLNADGSGDPTFNPDTSAMRWVNDLVLQSDGKVLITYREKALFQEVIVRLNSDGTLDDSFLRQDADPPYGSLLTSVVVQPDGKVIVGGHFATRYFDEDSQSYWSYERLRIHRVNPDGSYDNSFSYDNSLISYGYGGLSVLCLTLQPDGKVLVGGYGTLVNGTNIKGIARLNADGSWDSSFNPGTGVTDGSVNSIALQPDGKVLIGGEFTTINGTNRNRIARLNADGSLDPAFDPGSGAYDTDSSLASVLSVALQSDGKVLIGGTFNAFNGTSRSKVARLNADGSLDPAFNPGPNRVVLSVVLQPDGKVLAGGYSAFLGISYSDFYSILLNRLNPDGSRDFGFEAFEGEEENYTQMRAVAVQPDGKVLVGGDFTIVKGSSRNGIARLNANGTLDGTFDPGTGVAGGLPNHSTLNGATAVLSSAVQADGKVLIGGNFSSFDGTSRNGIARLNNDGSVDTSFNPGTGTDGVVRSIALQADGSVLIGGDFNIVNGVARPHVARLYGDALPPSLNIARSNASVILSWPETGLNFQLQECIDLSLPNSWSPVAQPAVTNADQISVTVSTTVGRRFFRLKSQ